MSTNKNDRKAYEKFAQSNGCSWNSNGTKMTNGNGISTGFSSSGGSINLNGDRYSTLSDAKNSWWWKK